jgi:hypothetical protein
MYPISRRFGAKLRAMTLSRGTLLRNTLLLALHRAIGVVSRHRLADGMNSRPR